MGCLVGLLNMVSNIQKCPKTKTKCKNTQPPTTILLFLLVVWLLLCFCFLGRRPSGMCGLTSGLILNLLPTKSSSFCLPDDDMLIQRTLLNYLGPNFRHQANSWAWQKKEMNPRSGYFRLKEPSIDITFFSLGIHEHANMRMCWPDMPPISI